MRRFILLLALLAACSDNPPRVDETADVQWVKISAFDSIAHVQIDGIDCVVYSGSKLGGIDCNWAER